MQGDPPTRAKAADGGRRNEHTGSMSATEGRTRGQPQAETRGRAGYNDARHAAPPIPRRDTGAQATEDNRHRNRHESAPPQQASAAACEQTSQRTDHRIGAQPLDGPAHTGHAGQPGRERDAAVPVRDASKTADSAVAQQAERAPRDGSHKASDVGYSHAGASRGGEATPAPAAKAYHRDHDHHGNGEHAKGGERPDNRAPNEAERLRHGADAPRSAGASDNTAIAGQRAAANPDTQGSRHQPEPERTKTVYIDGHEIEVTGKPDDGIWVPGLPGKAPDRIGDVLGGPDRPRGPRASRFLLEATKDADDLSDAAGKPRPLPRTPSSDRPCIPK